jgi:myosin heavy subunit
LHLFCLFVKLTGSSWFGDAGGASAAEYLSTWTRFLECLQQLGFTDRELSDVARMLAAVLHIGNVNLVATKPQNSQGGKGDVVAIQAGSEASAKAASELLGLPSNLLKDSLMYRNVKAGMEQLRVPLTRAQAIDVRDGLAKGVYSKLVTWVVGRMNAFTSPPRQWADWQRVLAKKGTGAKAKARWQKYWDKVDT